MQAARRFGTADGDLADLRFPPVGREGGDGGGRIVAEGTPEEIVNKAKGYTYKYLKGKI